MTDSCLHYLPYRWLITCTSGSRFSVLGFCFDSNTSSTNGSLVTRKTEENIVFCWPSGAAVEMMTGRDHVGGRSGSQKTSVRAAAWCWCMKPTWISFQFLLQQLLGFHSDGIIPYTSSFLSHTFCHVNSSFPQNAASHCLSSSTEMLLLPRNILISSRDVMDSVEYSVNFSFIYCIKIVISSKYSCNQLATFS